MASSTFVLISPSSSPCPYNREDYHIRDDVKKGELTLEDICRQTDAFFPSVHEEQVRVWLDGDCYVSKDRYEPASTSSHCVLYLGSKKPRQSRGIGGIVEIKEAARLFLVAPLLHESSLWDGIRFLLSLPHSFDFVRCVINDKINWHCELTKDDLQRLLTKCPLVFEKVHFSSDMYHPVVALSPQLNNWHTLTSSLGINLVKGILQRTLPLSMLTVDEDDLKDKDRTIELWCLLEGLSTSSCQLKHLRIVSPNHLRDDDDFDGPAERLYDHEILRALKAAPVEKITLHVKSGNTLPYQRDDGGPRRLCLEINDLDNVDSIVDALQANAVEQMTLHCTPFFAERVVQKRFFVPMASCTALKRLDVKCCTTFAEALIDQVLLQHPSVYDFYLVCYGWTSVGPHQEKDALLDAMTRLLVTNRRIIHIPLRLCNDCPHLVELVNANRLVQLQQASVSSRRALVAPTLGYWSSVPSVVYSMLVASNNWIFEDAAKEADLTSDRHDNSVPATRRASSKRKHDKNLTGAM